MAGNDDRQFGSRPAPVGEVAVAALARRPGASQSALCDRKTSKKAKAKHLPGRLACVLP